MNTFRSAINPFKLSIKSQYFVCDLFYSCILYRSEQRQHI